jgi:hypothetical protein
LARQKLRQHAINDQDATTVRGIGARRRLIIIIIKKLLLLVVVCTSII